MDNNKRYEMMCLLRPDYDDEEYEEKQERLESILTSEGATVEDVEDWGKRKLAYEINDFTQGHYMLFNFTSPAQGIDQVIERSNVEEGLLRYQVVETGETSVEEGEE